MKRQQMLIFALTILIWTSSGAMLAQETNATFLGSITDATGAGVPDAMVKATNLGTNRLHITTTDGQGNYLLPLLPIGAYEIAAEKSGFKQAVRTGIGLHVGDSINVSFTLEVGQTTERVEVSAQVTLVNTESGSVSELLGAHEVGALPVNGRNFNQLVGLMPGTVSSIPDGTGALAFNRAQVSINGARNNDNNWSNDGIYNVDTGNGGNFNDSPALETIAEFRLLRGSYDAEYGVAGGGQVNIITKSGTKEFHGHFSEYFRNNAMDSRNFFAAGIPPLRFNDFGLTVGGPVLVPKVYNRSRNKTFFFAALEFQRIRNGLTSTGTVPIATQRTGDFRGAKTIKDPLTGQNFPNNIIPASRIDANALAISQVFPLPNLPGTGTNFTASPKQAIDYRQDLIRVDHQLTSHHQLMFRGSRNHYDYDNPQGPFPIFVNTRRSVLYTWGLSLISSLGPSIQNEFQVGRTNSQLPNGPKYDIDPKTLGVNIPQLYPDTPENYPFELLHRSTINPKIPNVTFTGYTALNNANWTNSPESIWQFRDNLSKVIGRHSLKTGFLFHREYKVQPRGTNIEGTFNFDGRKTNDGYADFLLGLANTYTEQDKISPALMVRHTFEAYLNDQWRLTKTLSLVLGVRYSYFGIADEQQNKFRAFSEKLYDPKKALQVAPSGELVSGIGDPLNGIFEPRLQQNNKGLNLAPRLSLAWNAFGNGKTVFRAGYGLYYGRENSFSGYDTLQSNPPIAAIVTLYDPLLSNPGGGTGRDFPKDIFTVDLGLYAPYYQNWSLGIQREVLSNTVLDVSYVGNKGTHLMRSFDMNQPFPSVALSNGQLAVNQVRPYYGWGQISRSEQSASASYNSLQVSLTRAFHKGLSTQVSYTFSKALTDTGNNPPNSRSFVTERGPATFDRQHNFVAGYVWELPLLRKNKGWLGTAFGGWQLSGITRMQTGAPLDVTLGRDIAGTAAGGNQRPQVIKNPNLSGSDRTPAAQFLKSAFVEPVRGTFATTSRGIVRGPGINNWDLALFKQFPIGERRRFEFRGDFYNAFNHTQFSSVQTGFYNAALGQVTGARQARVIQLGAIVRW